MEEHARRIYEFGSEGDRQPAQTLAERLDSLPDSFTARDVTRKGWADLTTHEDVDRALGTLEEHGWVKGVETPSTVKGGRPTIHYYPNPRRPGRGPQ
jgi:hypothetical protein